MNKEVWMDSLYGCYAVLAYLPIWGTLIILYLLTGFAIDAGREKFEGFSYNVSHAARYGDVGLVVCILIGATILHRQPVMPHWLNSIHLHIILGSLSICVAVIMIYEEFIMRLSSPDRQIMDTYHNILIVPLLAYLVSSTFILNVFCGSMIEKYTTIICFSIWLSLSIYDMVFERLNQREWLKMKGYGCILKK